MRRGAGVLATVLVLALLVACAAPRGAPGPVADLTPTGRPVQGTDEASLWAQADHTEDLLKRSPRVVRDPALQGYVHAIVCRLAGSHCPGIRVYVVRHPEFDASMRPNGLMQVSTGLLLRTANEAQLAYILGHEIAHYLRRHSMQSWEDFQAKAVNLRGEIAGMAAFSRDQEREADQLGFELMVKSGYDPRQAPRAWERVMVETPTPGRGRGTSSANPFLETHPPTAERFRSLTDQAEKTAAAASEPRVGRDDYLALLRAIRGALLNDEVRRRQFASSEALLRFLVEDGDGLGELHFYAGEIHRLRGAPGDLTRAVAAYQRALTFPDAPPETQRSLGLVHLRIGDRAAARDALTRYLEQRPKAEDRDLIESEVADLARSP